jgi:phosphate starvation-inducible PhoH-like protein
MCVILVIHLHEAFFVEVAAMRKRSNRRRQNANEHRSPHPDSEDAKVRALFPGSHWSPDDKEPMRDQRFIKTVKPRSAGQEKLMKAIDIHNLVLALGPAGTGKTFLAVAKGVEALEAGKVSRIVLSRPAVEAGESIGFLPGAMEEKLAPYLRPLYDALADRLSPKRLKALMAEGLIEIAPIGYMRGRTLNNAFVVVDEAQNCTFVQLKMLLTRLGWNSTMVVTGDPAQSDLLPEMSGLADIANRLEDLDDIGVCRLEAKDIVRHPLVATMLTVL